jgi:hypothetical protein
MTLDKAAATRSMATYPTLTIFNFSCVQHAKIELRPVVVLIGPQASGKSVISKLAYFIGGLPSRLIRECRLGRTYREFKAAVERDFLEQFPASTWPNDHFEVRYEADDFELIVARREAAGKDTDRVIFETSDAFKQLYTRVLRGFRKAAGSRLGSEDDEFFFNPSDALYVFDRRIRRQVARDLGPSFTGSQLFIPAGRAFFTSLGSVYAAFERGGLLDPITREFGATFALVRDAGARRLRAPPRASTRQIVERFRPEALSKEFFGGEIRLGKQKEYVETDDGRRVPFSVLSSGQQELLPLWLSLDLYSARLSSGAEGLNEVFIEEPEAHLFPSTQSKLIEYLCVLSNLSIRSRMFVTTHSPYVLTKINNLMVAFQVGQKTATRAKVERIVPHQAWVDPDRTCAYALQDGGSRSIIKDGLIDASYIDSVSGDLAREFDQLLRLWEL